MKHSLLCPRTEICFVYRTYVDHTGDDRLGIITVTMIENRSFYSCTALNEAEALVKEGKVSADVAKRFEGSPGCLLIDQANKSVHKTRHDT